MWCKRNGVHRQYSAVYTPEQNGRAERANRDEIEGARALLLQRHCPTRFWPLAMEARAYVKNRVPAAGKSIAPLQMMFSDQVPDLSQLRVFGCSASLSIPKAKRGGKLNPVSVTGVFVGYSPHTKGWRVAVGNTIHVSPSVVFREEMAGDCSVVPQEYATDSEDDSDDDDDHVDQVSTGTHMHDGQVAPPVLVADADAVGHHAANHDEMQANVGVPMAAQQDAPRRSARVSAKPHRYEPGTALISGGVEDSLHFHAMQGPSVLEGYACAIEAGDTPKNYADIANFGDLSQLWYDSYARELSNMQTMKVITDVQVTDVPAGEKIIDSKLDFRNKYGPNGDIVDRKTRLCARGDQQQADFDYGEVYTPMAAADTTRVLLAEAAYRGMHVHQVDVKAAYLNASLTKPVYMRPPKGDPSLKGVIWKVEKAVYGLPESGIRWHEMLTDKLIKYGFTPCLTDACMFVRRTASNCTYVLVYVDDMLVAGGHADVVRVKEQLAQEFTIKDLGVAYHFLGFLIHRDEHGIRLTQEQYTKVVLKRFGYMTAHGKRTPFNEGTAKECAVRCQCASAEKYRQSFKTAEEECTCAPYDEAGIDYAAFVGAAMFLATRTRPDIAFSLSVLSRFVSSPKAFHAPLVKHLLRYLLRTIDWGLFYPSRKFLLESSEKIPEHMLLYTDSDHRGEEKMRSTSGWAVMLHGCPVAWGSKLQTTAVESTCAAEFIAACMGENAVMKLRDLMYEMTGQEVPADLLVDNQSAVGKLNRPAGGNMWLDLKWRVVHQRHKDNFARIRYIPTAEQVADIFTKSLTPMLHDKAVAILGMYCHEQKAIEYDSPEEAAVLLSKGIRVPMKKHTCIHEGAKECVVCRAFYAAFK